MRQLGLFASRLHIDFNGLDWEVLVRVWVSFIYFNIERVSLSKTHISMLPFFHPIALSRALFCYC